MAPSWGDLCYVSSRNINVDDIKSVLFIYLNLKTLKNIRFKILDTETELYQKPSKSHMSKLFNS